MEEKIDIPQVCRNIRTLRVMKELKSEDVARQLGIGKTTYSEIENNSAKITLNVLQQLADIFGVHYSVILNFHSAHYQNFINSPNAGVFHSHINENSAEVQSKILSLLEKLMDKI